MKNRRTDPESFDEDLDTLDETDTDDDIEDDDTPDDEDSDTATGTDPDDDEPDEEGYTAAERKELETLSQRQKSASDKISADGRRLKELEKENEELRKAQQSKADDDEEPTRRTRSRVDDPPDDDEEDLDDFAEMDFSDIDISKLDANNRKALERMYDGVTLTQRQFKSIKDQLAKSERENARLKQDDERYQKYREHYGVNRDQYENIQEAYASGDEIEAQRLITIHSAAYQRRKQRAESLGHENGYLPHGSPDSPPSTRRKTLQQEYQEKFDNAKTDKERAAISQQIWETFDAVVAEEMTLPSPVS